MVLTDEQVDFLKERVKNRMGRFTNAQSKPVYLKSYTCPCGHTELYPIYGECPVCYQPVKIRGVRYTIGTLTEFARELGIHRDNLHYALYIKNEVSTKLEKDIYRVLGITEKELMQCGKL